jgi:outer membrane protein assembly factor BamB
MEQKKNNHLLRRTLMPLLIVALPIAAMVAYIFYYKLAHRPVSPALQSLSEPVSFGLDNWPVFRGNAALTGQADGTLPQKLSLKWTFQAKDAVRSAPIIAQDKVFVSSMDKHLYAIDLATGKQVWKFQADDELEAAPLYHDDSLYVGSANGAFYSVNAHTGQQQWVYEVGGKIVGAANIAEYPKTHGCVVVFGSYDNNLYALEAETGELVFKHPAESYINGSIAVADNAAVFGSCDANIYWVPIADPNAAVTINAGSYVATNPAVDDGVIYAGSYEGVFLAADVKTQKILWQFDESEDAFLSSPAVNNEVVVVGCRDRNVYCLDRFTGKKRWAFSAQDNFDSSPVICGDKVAIGCDDGRLYLLDIQTGKEIFSYTLGSPILSSPAIAQSHLIIGCDNGTVYAFVAESD